MKDGDAMLVTTFLRLHSEGFKPDRDLILALTADEEGGKSNGVDWLLKNHPELMKAAFAFNPDGGGVELQNGKAISADVDASEKLYADYQLSVTNPGGHSSLPVPDNAIYHLADALQRLQNYQFPFELNAITRAYFEKLATLEPAATAADMQAMLASPPIPPQSRASPNRRSGTQPCTPPASPRASRPATPTTRCPQMAQANVNCRILPGHSREEVRQDLIRVFNDPKVTVKYVDNGGGIHSGAPDSKGPPPVALDPDSDEAPREARRRLLAWHARRARHGHRRIRQHLHQRRRHPHLQLVRESNSRPTMCARTAKTNACPSFLLEGSAVLARVRAHDHQRRLTRATTNPGAPFWCACFSRARVGKWPFAV
jgi:acetylornithine deacetylase/succinyl-diaminopimelate desuccinylase-like protein